MLILKKNVPFDCHIINIYNTIRLLLMFLCWEELMDFKYSWVLLSRGSSQGLGTMIKGNAKEKQQCSASQVYINFRIVIIGSFLHSFG